MNCKGESHACIAAGWLKDAGFALAELLCPAHAACLCCSRALGEPDMQDLCTECVSALETLEALQAERTDAPVIDGVDSVNCAYPYKGHARRLVVRLKYAHMREAAAPLARAMAMLPAGEADVLTPVPTTRRRERERGYNQAAVLCEGVARETGMPVLHALHRQGEQAAQTGLGGYWRRRNLQGAMWADERISGMRALLVDDVLTTGATVREAARALREAGAAGVSVLAAAQSHGDRRKKRWVSPGAKGNIHAGL